MLDYAKNQMNKGSSLGILAEQGVNVKRNLALSMELYKEAEVIFLSIGSLLYLAIALTKQIIGLWSMFQKTREEDYLIEARNLCKKALEVGPNITHLTKEIIIALLFRINTILADKYLASDKSTIQEILKYVRRLPLIEKKIEFILDSVKLSTEQIIENIRKSGEKISEEIVRGFTGLADDLRVLNKEQKRKLLEELCRLLTDPTFQKKFLRESPPEKRNSIKSLFSELK